MKDEQYPTHTAEYSRKVNDAGLWFAEPQMATVSKNRITLVPGAKKEVRDALRAHGFKFHRRQKAWVRGETTYYILLVNSDGSAVAREEADLKSLDEAIERAKSLLSDYDPAGRYCVCADEGSQIKLATGAA